jgi:plastocyanin
MKRVFQAMALAGLAALTVACSSGGGTTPSASAPAGPSASASASGDEGSAVTVVAKDIAFDPTAITLPADTATEVILDNQEAAPHNIAIKDAAGTQVFKGEIVTQQKITYTVGPLAAGSYTFWCEVHPNMTGTVTVQ